MFARVFDTAKRILSRSPSYQTDSEEQRPDIPRSTHDVDEDNMVTTRRGADTEQSAESTPANSVKRSRGKRHLEVEVRETPTASKRRRKGAAAKTSDAGEDGETAHDSVEAPADAQEIEEPNSVTKAMPHRTRSRKTNDSTELRTPIVRRASPKILIPASSTTKDTADDAHESETGSSQADVFYTPAQHSFALPADEEGREGSLTPKPTAKATPATGKGSGKRGRPRKHPLPASPEKTPVKSALPDEIPSSTWDSEQASLTPTKQNNDSGKSSIQAAVQSVEPLAQEEGTVPENEKEQPPGTAQDATVQSATGSEPAADQVDDLASRGIAFDDVAPDATIAPPRRHQRFGSEDPADVPDMTVQTEPSQIDEVDNDDDANDSDEAPEMVTTSAAASKAKAAAEETSRAHEAQQAKEDKRRKERADRIAQEQAEKREREEKKARKLAQKEAKLARRQRREASSPPRAPTDVGLNTLPDLLPDSILEAAGNRRPPTPPPVRRGKTAEELQREKLSRHIKFLESSEKPIKDVKKGKVNVSVLSQRNTLLAPKVNKKTKNVREHWLKGREEDRKGKKGMKFKKMERRPASKGFLRSGDDD
ncbi:hypothetical protein BU23DRAFT_555213, partial [Bimuria novae-zelandiae CBS 107.79]